MRTEACAALVSQVPTFVAAICTLNRRPKNASGAPLGGLDPEAGKAAGGPGPETDHRAADDEPHARQTKRRGLLEAHLDHDGVGAPENRDEHGHGRALEVHVFRRMAQNAFEDTTPGIIAP